MIKEKNKNMDKSFKLKKSFVWFSIVSQAAVPLMLSFSPAVQANINKKKNEYETYETSESISNVNGEQVVSNKLINSATQKTENYLNQFGSSEIKVDFDENFDFKEGSIDALLSLKETEQLLTFGQFGARHQDERTTVNLGVGQRHFFNNQMVGYNAFYDHELDNAHSRASVGAEYAIDYLKASANGYFGITDWTESDESVDFEEKVADGFDVRLEGYLPAAPQLGAKLMYEQYFGDNVNLFGDDHTQSDPSAVTIGLNYTPVPLLTFGAEHKMGQDNQDETIFTVGFNIRFGESIEKQLDPANVAHQRSLAGQRYDLVSRNNTIVLDHRAIQRLKVSMASSLTATEGETARLDIQVSGAKGSVRYEWLADAFFAAGGKIIENNGVWELVLPEYVDGGINTYEIGLVVIDSEGNRSPPAYTHVVVNKSVSVDKADSSGLKVIGDGLFANSADTAEIALPVYDENGNPRVGVSVEFTITDPDGSKRTETVITDSQGIARLKLSQSIPGVTHVTAVVDGKTYETDVTFLPMQKLIVLGQFGKNGLTVLGENLVANATDKAIAQVEIVDPDGNPLFDQEVSFDIKHPDGRTETIQARTDKNGIASIEFTESTFGQADVSVTLNGQTQTKNVVFGDAGLSVLPQFGGNGLTISGDNLLANGTDKAIAEVAVVDAGGNPLPSQDVSFVVTHPDGTKETITAKTDQNGIARIEITESTFGQADVSVTLNGQTQTKNVQFDEVVVPAAPVLPQFGGNGLTVSGANLLANGTDKAIAEVEVVGADGKPLSGQDVSFVVTHPDGKVETLTAKTDANGIARIEVTESTAGQANVSVTLNGQTQTKSAVFEEVIVPQFDSNGLTLTGNNLVANGRDKLIAEIPVVDQHGNPLPGQEVTFTVIGPNGTPETVVVKTDSNGIARLEITETDAGNVTVTAMVGQQTSTGQANFLPDPIIPNNGLKIEGFELTANGTDSAIAKVTVVDKNGLPIAGQEVVFTVTGPDGIPHEIRTTTDANGVADIAVTQTQAGETTITVQAGDSSASGSVTFNELANPDAIPQIGVGGLLVTGDNLIANGSDKATASLPVVDVNGLPLVDQNITFTITSPDGSARTETVKTDANGIATIDVTQVRAGETQISVTVGGVTESGSATFAPDPSTATFGKNGLVVTGNNVFANGADNAIATVPVVDANGNPLPNQDVTFKVTTPDGTVQDVVVKTDSNGIATLELPSTKAGEATIEVTVGNDTQSGKATYVGDPSTATFGNGGLVVTGNDVLANGSDKAVATLPVVDANGNPLANHDVTFTVKKPDGTTEAITVKTDANGIATFELPSTKAGEATIEVTLGNTTQTGKATFIADVSTAQFDAAWLQISKNGAVADPTKDFDTAEVRLVDANNNPIVGADIVFSADAGISLENTTVKTNAEGKAIVNIKTTKAGTFPITASFNQKAATLKATFIADISTATLEAGTLAITKNNAVADPVSDSNMAQVRIVDANKNPIQGAMVNFSGDPLLTLSSAAVATDANGIAKVKITSTKAGMPLPFKAELNGISATLNTTFVAGAPDATKSVLTASPQAITTLPNSSTNITLALKDKYSNPITGKQVQFTSVLPNGNYAFSTVTPNADGTYTGAFNVSRTGSTTATGITTPVSVNVGGVKLGNLSTSITVDRAFYLIPVEQVPNEQPITSAQLVNLFNQYESIKLNMTNGRWAPTIVLPMSGIKTGSAIEINADTTYKTVLTYNNNMTVTFSSLDSKTLRLVFNGTTWSQI